MTRPVVLLHPLGVGGEFWRPVTEHLPGVTTIAPDLPGHGDSPALPAGSTLADTAAAVLAGLDGIDVDTFDLVGVSLGGLVAQQLAATAPGRVSSLVLADTVHTYPPAMRQMWQERAVAVRREGMAGLVEPTLALWFTPGFREQLGPVVRRTAAAIGAAPTEGYARACELLQAADTSGLLSDISCPTLVVCGVDDAGPFRSAAHTLSGQIAGAQLAWLPGGHASAIEHPADFAAHVRQFTATERLPSALKASTGGAQ